MNASDTGAADAFDGGDGGFLKRNWLAMTAISVVLAGGAAVAVKISSRGSIAPRKAPEMIVIDLPPPPPPVVLPPPPPPPPVEEEMIEHEDEVPEEAPPDNAPSTGVVSNGPADGFGLRAKGGNGGARILRPRSPASLWAPYAGQAASKIAGAIRRHEALKRATLTIQVRVWIDSTGRITRATTQSTGDAALDRALREEVLQNLQLSGPPPDGMKMPVNLKISARRAN